MSILYNRQIIIDKDKALGKAKQSGNIDDWKIAKFLEKKKRVKELKKTQFFDEDCI